MGKIALREQEFDEWVWKPNLWANLLRSLKLEQHKV